MKNIRNTLLNEFYVKLSFIILGILYCIPIFMVQLDNFMNVLLVWAAIVIINDLCKQKSILKFKYCLIAYTFLAVYFCTIAYNSFQMVDIKVSVYMFLQICFFVYIDKKKNVIQIKKEFNKLCKYTIILGSVICILSLILYFLGYCEVYTNNVMSMELIMGRHPNSSLYGLIANSNWMSFLCLTIIAMCYYLKKLYNYKGYYFLIFISVITLFLTNSRGGLVGFIVFTSAIIALYFRLSLNENKKRAALYLVLLPICIISILLGNVCTKWISGSAYQYFHTSGNIIEVTPKSDNSSHEQVTVIARDKEEEGQSTNIRIDLLIAGTKVVKENFLYGVGMHNLGINILEKIPLTSQVTTLNLASNTHNIYMQTAVVSGGVGILLFLFFILFNVCYVRNKIIQSSRNELRLFITIYSLVISYLVINLVEADIFMSRNFMSALFWIVLGYLVRIVQLSD